MDCHEVIVSVESGHENRVARDLLDLLFPYDTSVNLKEKKAGKIILNTCIDAEALANLLKKYPVRHLLKVKFVVRRIAGSDINKVVEEIVSFFTQNRVPVGKISVRLGKLEGWKQEFYTQIMDRLRKAGLLNTNKGTYTIEVNEHGDVLLTEVVYTRESPKT